MAHKLCYNTSRKCIALDGCSFMSHFNSNRFVDIWKCVDIPTDEPRHFTWAIQFSDNGNAHNMHGSDFSKLKLKFDIKGKQTLIERDWTLNGRSILFYNNYDGPETFVIVCSISHILCSLLIPIVTVLFLYL